MTEEVFAERVRKAIKKNMPDKPDVFVARLAERFTRWVNSWPGPQQIAIKAMDMATLEARLKQLEIGTGQLHLDDYRRHQTPVSYAPGAAINGSKYVGQTYRLEFPAGWVEIIGDPMPATRQRTWAGIPATEYEPDEILVRAENKGAVHQWAESEGYGRELDPPVDGEDFEWFVPVDEDIPIKIKDGDPDADPPEPPSMSVYFHVNVRVL